MRASRLYLILLCVVALLMFSACHSGRYGRTTAYKSSIRNLHHGNRDWYHKISVVKDSIRHKLTDPRRNCNDNQHGVWAYKQQSKRLGIFIPPMRAPSEGYGIGH